MKQYYLTNKHLKIIINSRYCEVVSMRANNKEYIYQQDDVWKKSWPILFPWTGKMNNDAYFYQNKQYNMPKHGFLRLIKNWKKRQYFKNKIVFSSTKLFWPEYFPFAFKVKIIYSIHKHVFSNEFIVKNCSNKTMYYGFGWHPAFKFQSNSAVVDATKNSKLILMPSSGLIPYKIKDQTLIKTIRLSKYDFSQGQAYAIFQNGSDSYFLRDKEKTIEIIAPNYPNFIIWKPNQICNFVCVEPWASIPDHEKGAKVDLSQKMGVLSLGRHKKNKFFMKIKVIK